MTRITVSVSGRQRGTQEVIRTLRRNTEQIAADFASGIVSGAQRRVAVDTGSLRDSIRATKLGPSHYQVRVGAEYGAIHEYGTGHGAAQPFFHPAVREQERITKGRLRRVFRDR